MDINWKNRSYWIGRLYFWGTICGMILFFFCYPLSMIALTAGANSMYVALTYGGFSENTFVVHFCACWFLAYPVALVIAYVFMVKKGRHLLFLITMCADAIFVCFAGATELSRQNDYGFNLLLPDIVFSCILCGYFIFSTVAHRQRIVLENN